EQAGIRYFHVTGVQTCALPICDSRNGRETSPPSCASQRSAPELVIHETSLAFYACECQRLSFRWAPSGPRRGVSLARLLETARQIGRATRRKCVMAETLGVPSS